jgi:hypothetical protein
LQTLVHRLGHSLPERSVIGDQDRLRALVMLGLAQKVDGDPVGVIVGIRDHEDFGGPAIMSMPTLPNTRRLAAAT